MYIPPANSSVFRGTLTISNELYYEIWQIVIGLRTLKLGSFKNIEEIRIVLKKSKFKQSQAFVLYFKLKLEMFD